MNSLNPEGEGKTRESPEIKATRFLGTIAMAFWLSGGSVPPARAEDLPTAPTILSESERRAQYDKQCDAVEKASQVAQESIGVGKKRRKRILEGISIALSCGEFPGASFDPSRACIVMTNVIRKHPRFFFGRNSVLRPILDNLYRELQCQGVGNPASEAPIEVKELFKVLKVEIERDPPKLLDPKTTIKELCEPGLQIVGEHQSDIEIVGDYLLSNYKLSPVLKLKIEEWRNRMSKQGTGTPAEITDDELKKALKEMIGEAVVSVGMTTFLCVAPETLAKTFGADIAKIDQQRREMIPLLRALIEVLSEDSTDEGAATLAALTRIAQSIADVK